ncbi:uncharacterized protein C8R40DRAFT_785774 [Lentinula edodes]|uniref:uncharacterized protein n=1 Tax=Lentinula edodes TaxID=5353 RepID=UPI001E8E980F|nr:uncharacterized protein C8R40DRAFT_785774 [Lentinula edodes]KAH7878739.1 hypothetical protein C8R40DRAFT_785774 [Lentinula edodes]
MSKPSLFRTIWRNLWHPTGFVGRDLEGNSYYEKSNPLKSAGYARSKRSMKYRNPDDMWKYIGGSNRLPIQWSAWLAHTRPNPPSIQELQMDLIRQRRVQHNAALIEASFQQERAQLRIQDGVFSEILSTSSDLQPSHVQDISSISASDSASSPSMPSVPEAPPVSPPESTSNTDPGTSPGVQRLGSSLPKTGSDEYQPESWTPKLRIRQG